MKLSKWLEEQERTIAWLEKKTGIQSAYISRAISGKQAMGLPGCEKIFQVTEGQVNLDDMRPDLVEKYKDYECLRILFTA